MPRNNINPQLLSVAATFYEPVYQRLRSWDGGKIEHLFGFTAPTNPQTREILQAAGAVLDRTRNAECFAEVWTFSSPLVHHSAESLVHLDREISESLRCHHGRFTAACGTIRWDDASDKPHNRRHIISQLLQESRTPRSRTR